MNRRSFLLATLLLGCRTPTATKGTAVRIVSLAPAMTEALFAIGAGNLVVGRSRFCNYPPEASSIPAVGGITDPSVEAILALAPTLVVGVASPIEAALRGRVTAQFYFPTVESIESIFAALTELGHLTGLAHNSTSLVSMIGEKLEDIQERIAGLPKPRVLLLYGFDPIFAAGPESFANEMITRAGAINVITSGQAYPVLGVETVLAANPDLLLDAASSDAHGADSPEMHAAGFSKLRAVRDHHVIRVTDDRIFRAGPRIAESVNLLAKLIHPELQQGELH